MPQPTTPTPEQALHLPRILCLHGGGTNSTIFRLQLRPLLTHPSLSSRFRFIFVDAPFLSEAGAGILPFYSDFGPPFYRWSRWLKSHPEIGDDACASEIEYAVHRAMESDEGTGPWVGVLGFSQGAKVAVSLLYEQQMSGRQEPWRLAVVLAGRAPILSLSEETRHQAGEVGDGATWTWMQPAGGLPEDADMDSILDRPDLRLKIPTIHVHGLQDEGLDWHRRLVNDYCAAGTATLVEWDGGHRIPLKKADVDRVVNEIVTLADEYDL